MRKRIVQLIGGINQPEVAGETITCLKCGKNVERHGPKSRLLGGFVMAIEYSSGHHSLLGRTAVMPTGRIATGPLPLTCQSDEAALPVKARGKDWGLDTILTYLCECGQIVSVSSL